MERFPPANASLFPPNSLLSAIPEEPVSPGLFDRLFDYRQESPTDADLALESEMESFFPSNFLLQDPDVARFMADFHGFPQGDINFRGKFDKKK